MFNLQCLATIELAAILFIQTQCDWVEITQVQKRPPQITFVGPHLRQERIVNTTSGYNATDSTFQPEPVTSLTTSATEAITIKPGRKHFATITPPTTTPTESLSEKDSTESPILPLLNSIERTLTMHSKNSLKEKIFLLKDLRDNLLDNIYEKILMTNFRKVRSTFDYGHQKEVEARGHEDNEMEFPSNEGALLTIGFLTFAAFLTKLVLKLIYALKNKAKSSTTMAPTMMGSMTSMGKRKKRHLLNFESEPQIEDSLKILQIIEEYKII